MQFQYEVRYSRRKTLNIAVERDRKIVVRAPEYLSSAKIERIVQSRSRWIQEKLNHAQKYPVVSETKEFVSGETLMYLGINYQLLVVDDDVKGIAFDQRFRISRKNQSNANALFKQWYLKQGLEKIKPLAKEFAASLGVTYRECKTSEMKYRWGSCTPNNNIIFNWRIIKAPPYVVKYLVAHELVHLIENNHTPRFWNILSIQVPNYQRAKDWLKKNGHLLEIDF